MRRAVFQALRSTRRPLLRKAPSHRTALIAPSSHAVTQRFLSSRRVQVLQSSMHIRRFSVALVTAAVASGAWYYRQGTQQSSSVSTSAGSNGKSAAVVLTDAASQVTQSTRKALVVEQGQLYSGTIVGDGPVSKDTDESGRKVIEMMTPEQVTKKLRTNEESYLIGRGKGVVRYDVVQIPSNDPIEDDHAEKIIEVPQTTAATDDGSSTSDWMFWGVFDGHRYVITLY
jgi:pyruvate dehydrogenase phosphatase